MLELLRRKAQSPLIQATVVIIALVFIFWGVGTGNRNNGGGEIAVVNETPILYKDYQQAYDRLTTMYRDQLGGNLPPELLKNLNVKNQVLEQLIRETLLRQGAQEMGLMVSNQEVSMAIQKMEAFRNNNTFDINRYKAILANSRTTPALFESSMRTDLLSQKVMTSLAAIAKVSETEISDRFSYDHQQLNLEYVSFSADDFTDQVTTSTENLTPYYEEHQETYRTEPRIQVSYLAFLQETERTKAEVTDQEIATYYQENINRFTSPEQRQARHILLKSSPDDPEEKRTAKRQRAEELLAQIQTDGRDFATLAQEFSEGPTGPQGGDLGWFSRGQMVKAFEDAVFAMQKDTVSDIVETSFGFHIIKLEGLKPFAVKELNEAKPEITNTLQTKKAKALAFTRANQAYEQIILAGSLTKYGESSQAQIATTELFARRSPQEAGPAHQRIIRDPAFLETAFGLEKGEMSSLVELNKGYVILYAESTKPPEVLPLAEIQEKVSRDYTRDQTKIMAKEAAKELLGLLRNQQEKGGDRLAILKEKGHTLKETGLISRTENQPATAKDLPVTAVESGFKLSAATPFPENIAEQDRDFLVYWFKESKAPDQLLFAEQQEKIKTQLLEEKKSALLAAWLVNQKKQAEISINNQYL